MEKTDKKMTSEVKTNFEKPETKETPKKGLFRWFLILVVVIAIIFAGLYTISRVTNWNILGIDKTGFNGKWQAVFLSNGQVYFGQIASEKDDVIILKDIYYLQVTRKLQPAETEAGQDQNELSLVKLGNELHGPEDEMRINNDHVLFIEDLKPDGKVVRAIRSYIESQASSQE